jgi:nitrite reductase (NADH) small subunit
MTALAQQTTFIDACALDALVVGRGVAALIDGTQIALFRLPGDDVVAISNYDPFSNAFVLSRGIVGSKGEVAKVASPVFKHNFSLHTGECLDDPSVSIPTYEVTVVDGRVLVALP